MIKVVSLLLGTSIFLSSCSGHKKDSSKASLISEKDRINTLFNFEAKQVNLLTCDEEEKFFLSLPNNFEEYKSFFCKKYQLSDGRKLYLTRTLSFFENLYCIKNTRLSETLINWSKHANFKESCETFSKGSSGGYFDAVLNLQELVQRFFAKNVEVSVKVFQNISDNEIKSFWHFYFYSPHPNINRRDFEILYERYAEKNERIAKLMKEEFEKLLLENDRHGH